jgi:hypothetical protein
MRVIEKTDRKAKKQAERDSERNGQLGKITEIHR